MQLEVEMTKPDQFGQSHPIETPQLIQAKLKDIRDELDAMQPDKKKVYQQAQQKCPELVEDKDLLVFLRCDVFRVKVGFSSPTLASYYRATVL